MSQILRISVQLLDGTFHGREGGGAPEWPPSPLRLLQSLVCAAAGRWSAEEFERVAAPALRWLEQQAPPVIAAPRSWTGSPTRLYVPDNVADLIAGAWSRGNDASIADYRTERDVVTTYLSDQQAIHYDWHIVWTDGERAHWLPALQEIARSLFRLGWGIDLAAAGCELLTESTIEPTGQERWTPSANRNGHALRIPVPGTLEALVQRHDQFLHRLQITSRGATLFRPVSPLTAFDTIGYQRESTFNPPPCFAFSLLTLDSARYQSFATTSTAKVAAMLRHATAQAATAAGLDPNLIATKILGHGEDSRGSPHQPVDGGRVQYLPIPSLEKRRQDGTDNHVGRIRRALITVPANAGTELDWLSRLLPGSEVISETTGSPVALLTALPRSDGMIKRYLAPQGAHCWSTVTPVILPGRDDRKEKKTESLLRKALVQAGFSSELARQAIIDWSKVADWPGADHADRFFVPKHLANYPRYHVRIAWFDHHGAPLRIPGPIAVGGGRYCGLGLFAAEREE